ncbi:MAG: type II toxin-antitoxin system RelE/ParE family toxin [Deltaproteobacteria bacterium]|nr:type II toxin-antitoxin system RelE/ParE family toxin [Deltaproteobacteria bacterium]
MTFFHPEAEAEFLDAIEYYESLESGLGYDFAIEVRAAIQRAEAFPLAWTSLDGEVRRSLVRRFPFGVVYAEDSADLFILAVMHLHRAPDTWKNRR